MKIVQRVRLDFIESEPSAKADFIDNVVSGMTVNIETFPNPTPKLIDLTANAAAIRLHYKGSLIGNKEEIALLKDAITAADNNMRTEANYVGLQARGDETIILKSGFNATKGETTPSQPPAKSTNFRAIQGNGRGIIILETEKLEFAGFYTFIIGKDLQGVSFNGNFVTISSTIPVMIQSTKKKRIIVKYLESNVAYQCIVFGTASGAGRGEPSETITITTY